MAYIKLGRWPEAGKAFQQALKLNPKDAEAHLGLCAFYLNTGDREAAAKEYKLLQELDQDLAKKFSNLMQK
jgi:Flp pilus assembly protein TadD